MSLGMSLAALALSCLIADATALAAGAVKRSIEIDDLIAVRKPSQVAMSPDGRWVAYVLMTPSLRDNNYTYDLYVTAADGSGEPRPVFHGEALSGMWASHRKQSPLWTPSSDRLVFVAQTTDGSDIRAVRVEDGAEEVLVSREALGNEFDFLPSVYGDSLGFSPDGHWLAFLASRSPPERKNDEQQVAIEAHEDWTPIGQRVDPLYQLFVVDLTTQRVQAVTDTSVTVNAFDWSPDSRRLVIEADSVPNRIASYMTADIYAVDVAEGELRPLVRMNGRDRDPKWSPDGRTIAFGSQRGKEDWMSGTTLAIVQADGSAPPLMIGEALDRLSGGPVVPLKWSANGQWIDVMALHDLSRHVFRVRVSDGAVQRVTPRTDRLYDSFSYSRDGERVAFIAQGAVAPPEVYVSNVQEMKPLRLTYHNAELEKLSLPTMERLQWRSLDGKWDLQGILLKPSDYQPGKQYPMLTALLGGPAMVRQELNLVHNYPLLVLAQRGYVVFMPNTRGRPGYGMGFTHAIRDEKSYVLNPLSDALSGVDLLVEQGVADPKRLGILGFSYGGTLTAFAITQTNRFRAAIYGEGHPNILQSLLQYRSSDLLGLSRDMWGFGNPYEPAEIERAFTTSAIYRLNEVKTPVLIEAGERSAWETDRAFYRGLKYFDVPSEFWVYPRSGHGWDEPRLKQDAYQRHIAWFDYWIKDHSYPDPRKQPVYDAWKKKRSGTPEK